MYTTVGRINYQYICCIPYLIKLLTTSLIEIAYNAVVFKLYNTSINNVILPLL